MTEPADQRPVAFVHNWAPDYRRGLFEVLAARQDVRFLLFGGRSLHEQDLGEQVARLDAPAESIAQGDIGRVLTEGDFRAVVASTNGRVALASAYRAARRSGLPFVLWASMWRHPRTAAQLLGWPLTRHLYRRADAVVTYGTHVSRYVARHRPAGKIFEAPQATDNERMGAAPDAQERDEVRRRTGGRPFVLSVGRLVPEKGVDVVARAWAMEPEPAGDALLVCAGTGPQERAMRDIPHTELLGHVPLDGLRAWYAEARAVVLASVPTRRFLEPWGFVCNEALLQGTPVVATTAVGAVAGGLVTDGETGLVVPAGDARALRAALDRLLADPQLAASFGVQGRERVLREYTHTTQAAGFERALGAVGAARPSAR
ncbi:MAG: glycosyltransferase family 4 protein [Solirubrobacterales bacterium]